MAAAMWKTDIKPNLGQPEVAEPVIRDAGWENNWKNAYVTIEL